jgi:hypothetical protein
LLYLAAMFHDTGLPSPVPRVDFTVHSAAVARDFADRHGVPADGREVVTNAIAMHHTPGVGLESGPEAFAVWRAEAKQVPRGWAWYLHRFAVSDLSIRLAPFR